jgi:potassium voltage-gated channel Shaw-related subfamily C protein 1
MIILSVSILWIDSYSLLKYETFKIRDEITSTNLRMIDYKIVSVVSYLDYISTAWFVFDLLVRYLVAPKKKEFIQKFDNYVDLIATLWFYFELPLHEYFPNNSILSFFNSIRVFRLLRLLSYHPGLKVFIASIKESASVLRLLLVITLISGVFFSSFVYYAEKLTTSDPGSNKFTSIFDSFWFSVVTLTTIGYGDYVPTTLAGRTIGAICAFLGVLMMGLPMTIVVEIFSNFYNHLKARSKLPKQRRRILPVQAPRTRKRANTQHGHSISTIKPKADV